MLTLRQIDDLPNSVVEAWSQVEADILKAMVEQISKTATVTGTTLWQEQRLRAIGITQQDMITKLTRQLNLTGPQLQRLFDEAALRTLKSDDSIYQAAGIEVVPYKDNVYMQQITQAGLALTEGTFQNLARSTIVGSRSLFTQVLDRAHMQLVSGAFTYEQVIRMAVRSLGEKGLILAEYEGRFESLESAVRRTTLTGATQTAGKIQEQRLDETGTFFVETSAHPGARTGFGFLGHANWQGLVFFWPRGNANAVNIIGAPDFLSETGYGQMLGLCGINCRHSYYPFFPGLSQAAYSAAKLNEYNNKMVTYNGQKLDLYDASQVQRGLERRVRKWKREIDMFEGTNIKPLKETANLERAQADLREFIKQTGLRRDYFREWVA